MKKLLPLGIWLLIFAVCQPVPLTGRKQLHLVPEAQLLSLSFQSYDEFKAKHETVSGSDAEMVKKIGNNIRTGVEQYLSSNKKQSRTKNYAWEFNLFKDTAINAWCMPGGKVGVYTGILPLTQDETGIAVVLGHEIAHAIANHGDERMSQALVVQMGDIALSEALKSKPDLTRQLALAAFGLGAEVGVLLPYSRVQESEADRLGLVFMAIAGYDPNSAIPFWERMMKSSKGKPPEFLSSHPSNEKRIKDIQKFLPEAMRYYKNPTGKGKG